MIDDTTWQDQLAKMQQTLDHSGIAAIARGSNQRHGGPFDRGSADSYYRRGPNPHYYVGGTGTSELVECEDMTQDEVKQYLAGYLYNESIGSFKDWGDDY